MSFIIPSLVLSRKIGSASNKPVVAQAHHIIRVFYLKEALLTLKCADAWSIEIPWRQAGYVRS